MRSFRIASLAIVLISSQVSASTLYAVSTNTLRVIDQVTASQTLVGSLDPFGFVLGGAVVIDMTSDIRPDSFRLWAVSPNLPGRLVRINPVTGAATVVGPSINNTPLSMVAFDSVTGKLYGMARPNPNLGNDQLYLVNPDSAATAPIGTGVGAGIDFNSLGFDNTGELYAIRNFTTSRDVYRISTTTGLATFVAQTNLPDNVFDIATRPEDGVTFASVVNSIIAPDLYTVDLATGATFRIGSADITPALNMTGLAFSPAVPEPGSICLLGIVSTLVLRPARRL